MPDMSFGPIFIHAASFSYELVMEAMAVIMVIVVVAVVVVEKTYQGDKMHCISCPFLSPFGPAVFICRLNPA